MVFLNAWVSTHYYRIAWTRMHRRFFVKSFAEVGTSEKSGGHSVQRNSQIGVDFAQVMLIFNR